MKYLIAFALTLSGCATSSYNLGCQDALYSVNAEQYREDKEVQGFVERYCDKLEARYKDQIDRMHQQAAFIGER